MLEFYQAYAEGERPDAPHRGAALGPRAGGRGRRDDAVGRARRSTGRRPSGALTMREAVVDVLARGPARRRRARGARVRGGRSLAAAGRFGVEKPERFRGKKGKLLAELFEAVAEAQLVQPTFITEFPTEISPLSRQRPGGPRVGGPLRALRRRHGDRQRLLRAERPGRAGRRASARQAEEREGGDLEAAPYDEDYVEALEYGMPPTAGEGVGIDRLTMLLTDSPLDPRRHPVSAAAPEERTAADALRDLRRAALPRRPRAARAHVALIATISVVGLAVGVAALIVSLALLSGFQDRIRSADDGPDARTCACRRRAGRSSRTRSACAPRSPALPGVVDVAPRRSRGGPGRRTARARSRRRPSATATAARPARPESGARITGPRRRRACACRRGDALRLTSSRTRLSPIGPIPIADRARGRRKSRRRARSTGPAKSRSRRRRPGCSRARRTGAGAFEARLADPLAGGRRRPRARRARARRRLSRRDVARAQRAARLRAAPGEGRHLSRRSRSSSSSRR